MNPPIKNQLLKPIPFTQVNINDTFWSNRIKTNRHQTIPYLYQWMKKTGRVDAFRLTWKPGDESVPHFFWDSDVGKWIESAAYSLSTQYDDGIAKMVDEVVNLIVKAQQPDGYLNTYFTVVEPQNRWKNLRDNHELYCAGHLIEAAVAHYQATKSDFFLNSMCRYVDYISSVFGKGKNQIRGYCGHEEIELALIKLYRVTGNKKYLNLSVYFVEERGQQPYYFATEAQARGEDPKTINLKSSEYWQAHLPVRQQEKVVGHAVRAMYLYSAMTDLAVELNDRTLYTAGKRLWTNLTSSQMYVTGGIGSTRNNEGFTDDYDLPNETAYAETCAGIGLVFWNHRLLQYECDSRYADVMERTLYNGVLSSISLDGKKFFYVNPLASTGQHHRQEGFACACCPPNISRVLSSFGQYIYAQNDTTVAVHLYVQSSTEFKIQNQPVKLTVKTKYPLAGMVNLTLNIPHPIKFTLKLRIPGWCKTVYVRLNNQPVQVGTNLVNGYLTLNREWINNDTIRLEMSMPVERVYAHPFIRENIGRVAVQRGPLVYCWEETDNPVGPISQLVLPCQTKLRVVYKKNLLSGVNVITGQGKFISHSDWEKILYRSDPVKTKNGKVTAIPYYLWDNRTSGQMRVWLNEH